MGRKQGQYRRAYARRLRDELIAEMGAACVKCGSWDQLEFNHTAARRWIANRVNRWQRMILYRRDWLAGELELLCKSCNATDGARRRWSKKGQRVNP